MAKLLGGAAMPVRRPLREIFSIVVCAFKVLPETRRPANPVEDKPESIARR